MRGITIGARLPRFSRQLLPPTSRTQPDRKLRERALAAIATLTAQGRAVGYCVVGALQDPREGVLRIRNPFPTG